MPSTKQRILRASLFCAIGVATSLAAHTAHANPAFPELLQQNLGLTCAPACTICHLTNEGGLGTVKPNTIGSEWEGMFGLDGLSPSSLVPALNDAKLAGADADADQDGMPDYVELMMNENPSDPTNAAPLCGPGSPKQLTYGCAHVAPSGHVDNVGAAASALVAMFGLSALRRRSRRNRTASEK
ncbi:MAG TPA: hypothetical protein VHU80_22730 [Polyangiaceae bacterium]|jgi:hypothetical protein|nr:hypothetical protein [Polyangiaceae bacterium]